jgi:hypothetical protein
MYQSHGQLLRMGNQLCLVHPVVPRFETPDFLINSQDLLHANVQLQISTL